MRRLVLGRCWLVLMVATTGATPAFILNGCVETNAERQAFWDSALAAPWDPPPNLADYGPGNTALPNSWLARTASMAINDRNNDGQPDGTDLQRYMNLGFASISTWVRSLVDVWTYNSWADVGRPR